MREIEIIVSIHAPLRGATFRYRGDDIFLDVSIHAPLRGATPCIVDRNPPRPFQSTHPCGVRLDRATKQTRSLRFNPRTPAGCDGSGSSGSSLTSSFNPRTPAGCDLLPRIPGSGPSRFNPRTPAGCDNAHLSFLQHWLVFQSTHPCGVRRAHGSSRTHGFWSFNPRTPAGCDRHRHDAHGQLQRCFNPRTPAGCDINHQPRNSGPRRFQSTHPCGVRPAVERLVLHGILRFNPRTPAGCD